MRITGGTLGGRQLKVGAGVRPTQDKVRQAIFSAIATRVDGARVLDLFAGSGALGLEAWSRGAKSVTWVESHPRTFQALRETVRALCGDDPNGRVVKADAITFLTRHGPDGAGPSREPAAERGVYDLVLADPPYDREGRYLWLEKTLRALEAGPIVAADAILVFELAASEAVAGAPGWALAWERTYGDTKVLIWKRTNVER